MERRVLIHAPRGRDAAVVKQVLADSGMASRICPTPDDLLQQLEHDGAGAAVVTEEAFPVLQDAPLHRWLQRQPSWSDFPFVVLATRQASRRSAGATASLRKLGNVVLLERPVNAETLSSAVASALRGRARQYATRSHLLELEQTRATVERLNRELEDRIAIRTRELASANDRLMAEISERERAQAALAQAQKMEAVGRLTGGIAHDFNNLLHVVSMNLDLVGRLASEPKVATVAAQAKRAVSRGSKLTAQLLSFARSQSLLPRHTDVNALLQGMQELVAVSVGSAIRVETALHDGPVHAVLDANQLEMAVLNLAVNAKDAMPAGGALRIATRVDRLAEGDTALPAGDYLVVSVADEGEGIPQHLLGKVFDPFFTTKPLGSGTGLGLSQVYGFAQQSGGLARVSSPPGDGTTVEMLFPLAREEDAAPPEATAPAPAAPVGPFHILVVEDDTDVRRVIVESLQLAGHRVTAAADGPDGLQALEAARPDLLLVDYAMPGMTGAEVIEYARLRFPGLPVILATGYADMAEVGRVLGTQSVLIKPFDIATLSRAVAQVMSQRPAAPVSA
nr:response regulator [uncultured Xylophilus sp.]